MKIIFIVIYVILSMIIGTIFAVNEKIFDSERFDSNKGDVIVASFFIGIGFPVTITMTIIYYINKKMFIKIEKILTQYYKINKIKTNGKCMTIAVDFDGVLTRYDNYPEIGEPNIEAIKVIKELKAKGHKIILWTCRTEKYLHDALWWCERRRIKFDAVNENLPEHKEKYKNDCRKVYADFYIDDKNMTIEKLGQIEKVKV